MANVNCNKDIPKKTVSNTSTFADVANERPRVRGIDLMRDPAMNKGLAFTLEERQLLGVHGLLPPALMDQNHQLQQVMHNFYRLDNDLDRFIFIMGLLDRAEKLFYRVVIENIELMMPIIYTPTVGQACQKYGLVYRKPRTAVVYRPVNNRPRE